ncbi:YceI family protein [Epilithonimonas xixisoli]|uniref:Polyisoprenoid-binding protein YceI n=1 Tax=Epilithonimonas xixisoli TaxID=1476462 RepID=A0A4R8I9U0_9FLAO|nr:YceI family protein [Epilithonimonas xixisoli]TDX86424.1 polyisoprenoid-binding protein YceI [Epilithonimonas xixisoli]
MRTTKNLITMLMAMGTLGIAQLSNAQKITQKTTAVTISGTSPMHDWEMKGATGTFTGTVAGNAITNVSFTVPVKTLKAAKGKTMEKKAYEALKSEKAPNVTFTASSINIGKSNVSGKLTIAGTSKNVSFPVAVAKKGETYVIDGSETIKLSEFGMERPGFMGIKTGDVVTVKVNVVAE